MDNLNMIMYTSWIIIMIISRKNSIKSSRWRKKGWLKHCRIFVSVTELQGGNTKFWAYEKSIDEKMRNYLNGKK